MGFAVAWIRSDLGWVSRTAEVASGVFAGSTVSNPRSPKYREYSRVSRSNSSNSFAAGSTLMCVSDLATFPGSRPGGGGCPAHLYNLIKNSMGCRELGHQWQLDGFRLVANQNND